MFERKVYQDLLKWKNEYCPRYACLLEGARRVGKTTIALAFARKELKLPTWKNIKIAYTARKK